jgi:homoserine O-succinyltransferase
MFVLRRGAYFLFCQGHPEYDAGALLREYRRDVGRFLAGTMDQYPDLPDGYFDDQTVDVFNSFRERAHRQRTTALLDEFSENGARQKLTSVWQDFAAQLYRNWVSTLGADRASDAMSAALAPGTARAT